MNTTPKLISRAIKQAGFKSKAAFAREIGLPESSVGSWGSSNPVPPYLKKVLEWAKKAKKYDELIKDLQG